MATPFIKIFFKTIINLIYLFHFLHLDFVGNWLSDVTGLSSRLRQVLKLSRLNQSHHEAIPTLTPPIIHRPPALSQRGSVGNSDKGRGHQSTEFCAVATTTDDAKQDEEARSASIILIRTLTKTKLLIGV